MQIRVKFFVLNELAAKHLHLRLDSCQVTQPWHELYAVRLLNTNKRSNKRHAKGRTGDRKGILVTTEQRARDIRLEYRDLLVLQNYLRYLLSCFYPKNHLQDLWNRFQFILYQNLRHFEANLLYRGVYSTPNELSGILCVLFGNFSCYGESFLPIRGGF